MKKRIIICLDGTWNNPERDKSSTSRPRYKPTNILKTFRAVLPVAKDGIHQVTYYLEGVGAFVGERSRFGQVQCWADRFFGGLFGGGFEGRVKAAYRFLVGNYEYGDDIFIFGFSRGAAQAQSLVRFIDWIGGIIEKQDEYYIPELFDEYRKNYSHPSASIEVFTRIRERRKGPGEVIHNPQTCEIKFLGVYDTVLSLGSRIKADKRESRVNTVERKYSFHVSPYPSTIVRVIRHALAIDEQRWDYRPQIWHGSVPGCNLEQRWFPGVHSNIGGGYDPDGLANFPLLWMLAEARACGLEIDSEYLGHYKPNLKGKRPDELKGFIAFAEFIRGKLGRGQRQLRTIGGETIRIDPSALQLILEDDRYRPVALLSDLYSHPPTRSQIKEFSEKKRTELARIVNEFCSLKNEGMTNEN